MKKNSQEKNCKKGNGLSTTKLKFTELPMNAEKGVHYKINSLEPEYDKGFKTNIGVTQACHLQ